MAFQPTWLYIKQHNTTGLQYFGKTISNVDSYNGSGIYWTRHLEKHGLNIKTVWKQLFYDVDSLKEYAISFSKENNIVESKQWANLVIEDGTMGGDTGISIVGRQKISQLSKNRKHSEKTKEKIRQARAKQLSPMLGKKHKDTTKQKIRQSLTGKTHEDHFGVEGARLRKEKTSKANKGRVFSKERNLKISQAHMGKIVSDETRKKMSISAKKRCAERRSS